MTLNLSLNHPTTTSLSLPNVTRPCYLWRYYTTTLANIAGRHRLRLDREIRTYHAAYRLPAKDKQRWLKLFAVSEQADSTPFSYFTTAGTLTLMRILADLGLNFRYLLHLKSQMHFHDATALGQSDSEFHLLASLKDLVSLRKDRVALITESQVLDENGRLLATYTDTFLIRKVAPADMAALEADPRFGFHNGAALTRRPQPQYPSTLHRRTAVEIPTNAGLVYGRLSGDLNLVHTTGLMARLFGFQAAFVQGFFLANHVLKSFTAANGRPPRHLDIHFCRPAYTGQTAELVFGDSEFALCDDEGRSLAAGRCSL